MERSDNELAAGEAYVQPRSASEQVRDPRFPLAVRGYDRRAVEQYVAGVAQLVYDLESSHSPEAAVQRALAEVGEQTTGILQRAHQTAEEITTRAQIEADQQLRRADQEADQLRREAEAFAAQLAVDTRNLWEERQRLIEDVRQLADDVLATAEEAGERLHEPRLRREGGGQSVHPALGMDEAAALSDDQPTGETYAADDPPTGETYAVEDPPTGETYVEDDPPSGDTNVAQDPRTGDSGVEDDPPTGEIGPLPGR